MKKEAIKNADPKDQSKANFLGFSINTGSSINAIVKHPKEIKMSNKNRDSLSNVDSPNPSFSNSGTERSICGNFQEI